MNRHAKASPAGSPLRPTGRLKLLVASIAVFALALALGVGVAFAVAPVVSIENAEDVAYTTATVKGEVDPEDHETSYRFEYATQADFSDATQVGNNSLPENADPVEPIEQLSGLKPGTTYFLRLVAENSEGERVEAQAPSFTTEPVAQPIIPSDPEISEITGHTATFKGLINPNAPKDNSELSPAAKAAYKTHWWFTCEPGCGFDGPSEGFIEADAKPLNAAGGVEAKATGLTGNTPYKVTLHAKNGAEEVSKAQEFTSTLIGPEFGLSQVGAYDPTSTSATLRASVTPQNSKVTACHFVYGIGSASGNTIPCNPPHPSLNETQRITISATSGQFRLSFESQATPDLAFDASPATVQAALEGLASIGAGNVEVSGGPGGKAPYTVVFAEDLAGSDQAQITAEDGTAPLGGSVEVITLESGGTSPVTNEKQEITVSASGGQFKLSFESQSSGDLPFNATPEEVQAELEGLASIGAGNVAVASKNGNGGQPYLVTFQGARAEENVPQILSSSGTEPLKGSVQTDTTLTGDLSAPVGVSARLTGLAPDSEYHYKLVATNGAGTNESGEQSFRTLSAPPSKACPNESIRGEQHAASLPQCRAWELVSPTDKNGGDIFAEGASFTASTAGDGIAFDSFSVFGDAVGSGGVGHTTYIARRNSGGWGTHAITPPSAPEIPQALFGQTKNEVFSDDLSRALTRAYDLPGVTDDVPLRANLYVEDTATRSLRTISAYDRPGENPAPYAPLEFISANLWGASDDLKHLALVSNVQFLSPDIAPGYPNGSENVYTWDDGTLHLAGILPDGSVPPGGSTVGSTVEQTMFRGAMSPDGSRQAFLASQGGPRQLFLRIDGKRTVWISEPEGTDKSEQGGINFEGMTPDGKNVFFVSNSPLLDADTAGGPDLYRWREGSDPAHEQNLTLISNDGSAAHIGDPFGEALMGMSNDGEVVYVSSLNGNFTVWDGTRRVIDAPGRGEGPKENRGLSGYAPGGARVSADGRWLAYLAGHSTAYLYDVHSNTIACVSCPAGGGGPAAAEIVPELTQGNRFDNITSRSRYLSDDGQVFFSTKAGLLPEDRNGIADTYEYDGAIGELHLISSGIGDEPAMFADASSSGDDVFFVTRNRMAAPDSDHLVDVYDARVGGGFPDPTQGRPTPCSGEVCQGTAAPPPANTAIASQATGKGNVGSARCRAKERNSKGRCIKRKHHKKHRKAAHKRRASK